MAEGRVLLVDDEEEYLETLSERMETRGLAVTVARDGPAALACAEEQPFDVVFLDMRMPGMDGIETLKRLKDRNPDLEVILLTGHATVEAGVQAMKLGARDLIEKPADIQDLVERAKEAHADRLIVVEKRNEEKIRKILSERGW